MNQQKKGKYVKPDLMRHELLRDVTAQQLSRVVYHTPVLLSASSRESQESWPVIQAGQLALEAQDSNRWSKV